MDRCTNSASFIPHELSHGRLADMSADGFPTVLSAWSDGALKLDNDATHFGYVYEGHPTLGHGAGAFTLAPGMYFSVPGEAMVDGDGQGIVVSRLGYDGFFQIGGPVEQRGG